MSLAIPDAGSFRDPNGRIYQRSGEIFRSVMGRAADEFASFRESGLFDRLVEKGRLVPTREVDAAVLGTLARAPSMVLQHERLPFISYPYEWSFPLLKAAALLHLTVQLDALEAGFSLSDSTAYNVQFDGSRPVFIDVLSFRKYHEGEVWAGHRQFCEQFLNPLLLRAYFGIPHNAWFRGSLEGIDTVSLARMMPWWRNLSFNVLSHVTMQAKLQAAAIADNGKSLARAKSVKLSKIGYQRMLQSLRDWIKGLSPKDTGATVWQHYAETTTYDTEEQQAKKRFVAQFCAHVKPTLLWDIGCNTGDYSEVALSSGAERVVGFDFDQGALERAYARAKAKSLKFLPLFQDGTNPSPDQGWANEERKSLARRGDANGLLALAFEHHLAIGRNIPLDGVVASLVDLAPTGVIEFVQKQDPTVQQLLALREDIFPDYTPEAFEAALQSRARIVKRETVSASGRRLYWFDRSSG
jgi:ribosomal protein L11 methylase PrmA